MFLVQAVHLHVYSAATSAAIAARAADATAIATAAVALAAAALALATAASGRKCNTGDQRCELPAPLTCYYPTSNAALCS